MIEDNFGVHDNVSIKITKPNRKKMKAIDKGKFVGITNFYIVRASGLVVPVVENEENAIYSNFLNLVAGTLADSSSANDMTNLFTDDNQEFGGTEDGNDGIACLDMDVDGGGSSQTVRTCTTVTESATNTYGTKWKGDILFTEDLDIGVAFLGADLYVNSPDPSLNVFQNAIARQTFTIQEVAPNDRMVFEWEIYLT